MWYEFSQNNSGGGFDIDEKSGIGVKVWIEAANAEAADTKAEELGIYFDGTYGRGDCPCCGDRWSRAWNDEGKELPELYLAYDFNWYPEVYFHHKDGELTVVTKEMCENPEGFTVRGKY